ncbi:MAG: hypothetical protein GY856_24460 [bacterium]|nr:hypothetical protein [bacterium]
MTGRFHLPIFLLALSIAVVLKVAVHEPVQLSYRTIDAAVYYNLPESVVSLKPIDEVKLRLRGKRKEIAELNPVNVTVEVTLVEGELGVVDVTRERMNVSMPGDLEVISIEPNRFSLEVEPLETVTLPIHVVLTGEPSAGNFPGTPLMVTTEAKVRGPRSLIREMRELEVPISLEGHAVTFLETVPLRSPDPLVQIIEPAQMTVEVPMQERTSFEDRIEDPHNP